MPSTSKPSEQLLQPRPVVESTPAPKPVEEIGYPRAIREGGRTALDGVQVSMDTRQ